MHLEHWYYLVCNNTFFATGQYFGATIILVTVSIFLTVYILSLHFRLPGTRPVPKFMKRFALVYVARLLCLSNAIKDCNVEPEKAEENVIENNHIAESLGKTNGTKSSNIEPLKPLDIPGNRQLLSSK